jgi:gluconokinase
VVVIVMGVAGSGKSLIGRSFAATVGWRFVDADEVHSAANIAKMRGGDALTDADRAPWLEKLHAIVAAAVERREPLVLACSALKERYRDVLRGSLRPVRFVHLVADEATLKRRLEQRPDHFASAALLPSQLAALEPPADALTLDATRAPETLVGDIRREFGV